MISTAWLILQGRRLNALASGEETAASLGINVERSQFILMTITSLLTAAVVAVSRRDRLYRADGAAHCPDAGRCGSSPGSAGVGAARRGVPDAADIAARTLQAPVEFPIGIVTAAAGAPFFMWLLRSRLSDSRGR